MDTIVPRQGPEPVTWNPGCCPGAPGEEGDRRGRGPSPSAPAGPSPPTRGHLHCRSPSATEGAHASESPGRRGREWGALRRAHQARGGGRRVGRGSWHRLGLGCIWFALVFKMHGDHFIPRVSSEGEQSPRRWDSRGPGRASTGQRAAAVVAGGGGSDGEGDEAVVALDVPLQDLGAGPQHALEAGPVQLHALERAPGHHGGRPRPVQQQRDLPCGRERVPSGARPGGGAVGLGKSGRVPRTPGDFRSQSTETRSAPAESLGPWAPAASPAVWPSAWSLSGLPRAGTGP